MTSTTSRPEQDRVVGILLRIGAASAFGLMAAALKFASDRGVLAVEMLFYRAVFGLPVVVVWLMLGPGLGAVRTRRPGAHLARSALGISSILCTFKALTLLPLADATTIGFSAPIFATIFSAIFLAERVGSHRWAAVVVGFLGILIVMRPGGTELSHTGLAFALVSAIGTAAVTIAVRQLGSTEDAAAIVFWFFVSSAIVGVVLVALFGRLHSPAVLALLVAGGVAGGVAQLLMTASLRFAPVSVISPFDYTQFVWAVLLGWLLWDTHPTVNTWFGAAIIIGSGLYTLYREHRLGREKAPQPTL